MAVTLSRIKSYQEERALWSAQLLSQTTWSHDPLTGLGPQRTIPTSADRNCYQAPDQVQEKWRVSLISKTRGNIPWRTFRRLEIVICKLFAPCKWAQIPHLTLDMEAIITNFSSCQVRIQVGQFLSYFKNCDHHFECVFIHTYNNGNNRKTHVLASSGLGYLWSVHLFWNSKDSTFELSEEHTFPLSLPTPFFWLLPESGWGGLRSHVRRDRIEGFSGESNGACRIQALKNELWAKGEKQALGDFWIYSTEAENIGLFLELLKGLQLVTVLLAWGQPRGDFCFLEELWGSFQAHLGQQEETYADDSGGESDGGMRTQPGLGPWCSP